MNYIETIYKFKNKKYELNEIINKRNMGVNEKKDIIKIYNRGIDLINKFNIKKEELENIINNYHEDTITMIVDNKMSEEMSSRISQKQKSDTKNNNKLIDNRSDIIFFYNFLISWILEDLIIYNQQIINDIGITDLKLNGADKNREILTVDRIRSQADFVGFDIINKKEIEIELSVDFTGYTTRNNKIDLRPRKTADLLHNDSYALLIFDFKNFIFYFLKNGKEYEIDYNIYNNKMYRYMDTIKNLSNYKLI